VRGFALALLLTAIAGGCALLPPCWSSMDSRPYYCPGSMQTKGQPDCFENAHAPGCPAYGEPDPLCPDGGWAKPYAGCVK
jgi:hypothetical protein